jgi:hypothetical protein
VKRFDPREIEAPVLAPVEELQYASVVGSPRVGVPDVVVKKVTKRSPADGPSAMIARGT